MNKKEQKYVKVELIFGEGESEIIDLEFEVFNWVFNRAKKENKTFEEKFIELMTKSAGNLNENQHK